MFNKIKSTVEQVSSTIKTIIIKRKVKSFSNQFLNITQLYNKITNRFMLDINAVIIAISRDIDENPESYIRITDQLSKSINNISDEISTLASTIASEKDNLKNAFQKIKEITQDRNVFNLNIERETNSIIKSIQNIFKTLND